MDNLLVLVRGGGQRGELPILDGSARPYMDALSRAGFAPQPVPRELLLASCGSRVDLGAQDSRPSRGDLPQDLLPPATVELQAETDAEEEEEGGGHARPHHE